MPVLALLDSPADAAPSPTRRGGDPRLHGLAKGALLRGRDGRGRLDAGAAGGAVLLGHGHPVPARAALAAAGRDARALRADFADRLLRLSPAAEEVAPTGGGWAALQAALAGARAAAHRPLTLEAADPADLPALEPRLRAGGVAAVLARPLPLGGPALHALRRLCDRHGAALLLDERETTPRCGEGGAQALFGVEADLCVYGPALANGAALGALAGRRELVEAARALHPEAFRPSPEALAAGSAQADFLRRESVAAHLSVRGAELEAGLGDLLRATGADGFCRPAGDPSAVVLRWEGLAGGPAAAWSRLFRRGLWEEGVAAPGPLRLSAAYGDRELERLLDACAVALAGVVRTRRAHLSLGLRPAAEAAPAAA